MMKSLCLYLFYCINFFFLQVTHPAHEPFTETVSVPYGPDTFSALTHNFQLRKSSSSSNPGATIQPTCASPGLQMTGNASAALLPSTFTALTAFILYRLLLS